MKLMEYSFEDRVCSYLEQLGYKKRNEKKDLESIKEDIVKTVVKRNPKIDGSDYTTDELNRLRDILFVSTTTVFDKGVLLRRKVDLTLERDNKNVSLELIDFDDFSNNTFEYIRQFSFDGIIMDIVLMINSIPVCNIELKSVTKHNYNRIEGELENQIIRYKNKISKTPLDYIQFFVGANEDRLFLFSNNDGELLRKNKINWYTYNKIENKGSIDYKKNVMPLIQSPEIGKADSFAEKYLRPEGLLNFLNRYFIFEEQKIDGKNKKNMFLMRSYQVEAIEQIENKVVKSQSPTTKVGNYRDKSGFIFHATGSGKTVTSYIAAKTLMDNYNFNKVIFIVDRKDLVSQTRDDYNTYSNNGVYHINKISGSDNLINAMSGSNDQIIVTTVQLLATAIGKVKDNQNNYKKNLDIIEKLKVAIIFDEAHRSASGDSWSDIVEFFGDRMSVFAFTGTPIFSDEEDKNKKKLAQTEHIFGDMLAKYTVEDAIAEKAVVPYEIKYVGYITGNGESGICDDSGVVSELDDNANIKSPIENYDHNQHNNQFEDKIDRDSDELIREIAKYILSEIYRDTISGSFIAMAAMNSIDGAIKLYDCIDEEREKRIKDLTSPTDPEKNKAEINFLKNFKKAIVYSSDNRTSSDSEEYVSKENSNKYLEEIKDYCDQYERCFNEKLGLISKVEDYKNPNNFYEVADKVNYENHVINDLKNKTEKKLDLIIVCDKFLTGFNAPRINTLYLNKSLQPHTIIQAFARTNRILKEKKYGRIRYILGDKEKVDNSFILYCNGKGKAQIEPFNEVVRKYNDVCIELKKQYKQSIKELYDITNLSEMVYVKKLINQVINLYEELVAYRPFKDDTKSEKIDELYTIDDINTLCAIKAYLIKMINEATDTGEGSGDAPKPPVDGPEELPGDDQEDSDQEEPLRLSEITKDVVNLEFLQSLLKRNDLTTEEKLEELLGENNIKDIHIEWFKFCENTGNHISFDDYVTQKQIKAMEKIIDNYQLNKQDIEDIIKRRSHESLQERLNEYLIDKEIPREKRNKILEDVKGVINGKQ